MTDTTSGQTAPEPAVEESGAAPFSVGNTLREARLQQGLSVEDVSGRIKFAPRQIEALEADDFAHVPENAFLRGFVRSYARLLQLDPETLIAALPHAPENPVAQEPRAVEETPYPGVYEERKSNIIWLGAALAVAVLIGLFAWLIGGKPKEQHAAMKESADTRVEALALPAPVPVSAVPDAELSAHKAGAEQSAPLREKPVEKAAVGQTTADKAKAGDVKTLPAVSPAPVVQPAKPPASSAVLPAKPPVVTPAPMMDKKPAAPVAPVPATQPAKAPVAPVGQPAKPAVSAVPPAVKQSTVPAPVAQPVKPAVPVQVPAKPQGAGNTSQQVTIRMVFEGDSWTEIKDKDGNLLMGQLNHAGDERSVTGTPPFSVTIGYSSGVKLFYKGKQIDLVPHARQEVSHLTLE